MLNDKNLTVGIVGLGLIGGSMAKAAHSCGHRVLGCDKAPEVMAQALAEGVLAGELTESALGECDLLLLALYPQAAVEHLTRWAPAVGRQCVVIDLCGVKRAVCGPLEQLARQHGFLYLGGHPMAGMEKSGYGVSRGDLFQKASMILTPAPDFPAPVLERVESWFLSLGFGRVQRSTPEEHDRIIALTSQLAHVISCAYIQSPTAEDFSGFSAGSFQDMTRVARLNETMWTELFWDNREFLAGEIRGMAGRLEHYANLLEAGDKEGLFALLRDAREKKEESDSILRGGKR